MSMWTYLPCNRAEGQPCPYGCIMKQNKKTKEIVLEGDCRAPYQEDCYLNVQEKQRALRDYIDSA